MDDAFGVSMQGAEQRGREAARGAEAGTGRYIGSRREPSCALGVDRAEG